MEVIFIGIIYTDFKNKNNRIIIGNKKIKNNYKIIIKTKFESSKKFDLLIKEIIKDKMQK